MCHKQALNKQRSVMSHSWSTCQHGSSKSTGSIQCCSKMQLCHRDYSADDVLTTANAMERSRLQALSVACGRVRVPKAYTNITLSVTSWHQGIIPEENSTECHLAAQVASDNGEHWCSAWRCCLLAIKFCACPKFSTAPSLMRRCGLFGNISCTKSCRHKLHAEDCRHTNQAEFPLRKRCYAAEPCSLHIVESGPS